MKALILIILWQLSYADLRSQGLTEFFSELHSARMMGKKRFEMTPMFSRLDPPDNQEYWDPQNELGLQAVIGITEAIDVRVRCEMVWFHWSDYSELLFVPAIGVYLRILKDRVALSLVLGDQSFSFQPSLLITQPIIHDKWELTVSPKYIFPDCRYCDTFGSAALGLGISSDLNKWAIRPEYSVLDNFNSKELTNQFSLGFSWTFGKKI